MDRLPKKIDPSPLEEVVLEIRFQTKKAAEATFGVLYSAFEKDFPELEKLPVLQIPEQIRTSDPQLMYQPEYRMKGNGYTLSVGPRVISIACAGSYPGWTEFRSKALQMIEALAGLGLIEQTTRLGLRYINVFDDDIFSHSNLKLMLGAQPIDAIRSQMVTQLQSGDYIQTLRLANNSQIRSSADNAIRAGSVLDMDTALEGDSLPFFDNAQNLIDEAHEATKRLFFRILSDDYVTQLNPIY